MTRREQVRTVAANLLHASLILVRYAAHAYQVTLTGSDEDVERVLSDLFKLDREVFGR